MWIEFLNLLTFLHYKFVISTVEKKFIKKLIGRCENATHISEAPISREFVRLDILFSESFAFQLSDFIFNFKFGEKNHRIFPFYAVNLIKNVPSFPPRSLNFFSVAEANN